jgi:hypothetical protein
VASPIDIIAQAIADAITAAITASQSTLDEIASHAGGNSSSSPYSGVGDLVGIITGVLGDVGIFSALTNLPEDLLKGLGGGAGDAGNSFGFGYMLGSIGFELAEPYMRMLTHEVENLAQSQIFDPATAATLVTKAIISQQFGESEAAGGGFDKSHFDNLTDSTYTRPDIISGLTMLNRQLIQPADLQTILQYQGVPDYWWPAWEALARQLLAPADLALATLRGVMTQDDAAAVAAQQGIDADDFATLIENTGEPPGLMQLLEAYRRGFIDQATLERGIRQSRVRDEWIPTVEALRYTPMSTADAARAYVQNYLTDDAAAAIAQQNGLEPDHWQYIAESYGRPLAHGQMVELYYRGLATRDQFDQAMRESDIKDKYIDQSFELGVKLPGLWEIVNLLKDGALSADTATSLLLEQGYQNSVVAEIVKGQSSGKPVTAKTLTAVDILQMYTGAITTKDQAVAELKAVGYSDADAASLVSVADAKQAAKQVLGLIDRVHTQYDHMKLTDDAAVAELQKIGVDASQASKTVSMWAAVRPVGSKTLTEAQVVKVYKDGLIDNADATNRLLALGYSADDAALLIQAYG